ncbi:MAG: prephenate dehydrogenase/arogenate dehydrogenase family protein [Natronomonas sp.]
MRLLVVGSGEMGQWFAAASDAEAVAFADRNHEQARKAAESLSGGRAVSLDTEATFDVVCVAVPISATPKAIESHAHKASEAVVDVAGEMRDAVAALREHAPGRQRASFHPLFSAANAPGNLPVVVDARGPAIAGLRESLSAAGNNVFETTPEEHDRAMETVQARAHTAVLAYALSAHPVEERFQTALSATLAEAVDGMVNNTSEVYAEIQSRFDGADDVAEAAAEIADADTAAFRQLYDAAGAAALGPSAGTEGSADDADTTQSRGDES